MLTMVVQDHVGDVTLRVDDAGGESIRDYSIRSCEGYSSSDTCDIHPSGGLDSVCPPQPVRELAGGCAEYTHMRYFADHGVEEEWVHGRLEQHRLGCVLARPFALMLDRTRDGSIHHGVRVDTLPRFAPGFVARTTLENIRTAASRTEYGEALRNSILKFGESCRAEGDPAPCSESVDETAAGMSAFWASGFWSASESTARAGMGVRGGIAAVTVPLLDEAWLLFRDADDGLQLVRTDEPFQPMMYPHPEPVALMDGSSPEVGSDPAMARGVDAIFAAYRDLFTGELRVIRATLTRTWRAETRIDSPVIDGSPGLASLAGGLFVAFRDAGEDRLRVVRLDEESGELTEIPVEDAQPDEHDPFLVATGTQLVLLTAAGPRRICNPVDPTTCRDDAHVQQARFLLRGPSFSLVSRLNRLPLPLGLGAPPGTDQEPVGMPVQGAPGVGPAAVPFRGRLHLFVPFRTEEETPELGGGNISYYSFVPALDAPRTSRSRVLGLRSFEGVTRVAPFTWTQGGESYLFAAWADSGGQIRVTYKRSD